MSVLLIGILCILAVILLPNEPSARKYTPRKDNKPHYDPWVILALDELDKED